MISKSSVRDAVKTVIQESLDTGLDFRRGMLSNRRYDAKELDLAK
jgi:hypothetical protein